MKCRIEYVSNSSSSSFVVAVRKPPITKDDVPELLLSEQNINKLVDFGFKWMRGYSTWLLFSSTSQLSDISEFNSEEPINLYYDVVCNQDDVCDWLFENKIPFIASIHNDDEVWVYEGGDYYEVFQNFGLQLMSFLNTKEQKDWFATHTIKTNSYEKKFLNQNDNYKTSISNNVTQLLCQYNDIITKLIKKHFTDEEWNKVVNYVSEIKGSDILKTLNGD